MDKQFFSDEVHGMQDSLYRVAYSYLHSDADAADAVQETLTRAWDKRTTLREAALFRTWMTRILINVCKDMRKQRRRVLPMEQLPETAPCASSREREIRQAMDALDVKFRVPLMLFYLDGYSLKEIGRMLTLPQGTVKNRLFRGRQKLKDLLKEEVFDNEA